jgi:hypothetical protein
MLRQLALLAAAGFAIGCVKLAAQASAAPVEIVDTSRFLENHRSFTLLSAVPAAVEVDGKATETPNGQILYTGGPLQQYLNLEAMHPLYDVMRSFGATGVTTLARGRAEIFGGMGGLFVPYRTPYTMPNSWLTQISLGARVPLDQRQHFWLGGTAPYLTNFADKNRQWAPGPPISPFVRAVDGFS